MVIKILKSFVVVFHSRFMYITSNFSFKFLLWITHFLRTFYAFYALSSPFFLSNESVKLFLRIFYVLFYAFYALSYPFSFPMKVSSFFYAFFTYFLRFLRPFFSFCPFQWKCQAFFTHFLRTFYAFYALSSLFSFPMKVSSFFYAFFTYFLRFLRPFFSFFLSNESVKLFLRIFYVLFTLFTPFLILFSFPMKVSSFFYFFFHVLFTIFMHFLPFFPFPMKVVPGSYGSFSSPLFYAWASVICSGHCTRSFPADQTRLSGCSFCLDPQRWAGVVAKAAARLWLQWWVVCLEQSGQGAMIRHASRTEPDIQ